MFKVQLVNIDKNRMIPDKNNQGQNLKFDVLTFLEINKQTNIPTGKVRDKWYNPLVVNDFTQYIDLLTLFKIIVFKLFSISKFEHTSAHISLILIVPPVENLCGSVTNKMDGLHFIGH